MEKGFKTKCYPTKEQSITLSKWIGCQRFIKNAKVGEWEYHSTFAKKYTAIRAIPDQKYSQFITEQTQFLREVPSQILRNGCYLWMRTLQGAFREKNGFPQFRKKSQKESVYISDELFTFTEENGKTVLTLGTKKHPVGVLQFDKHSKIKTPKTIVITKEKSGSWSLSFCYEEKDLPEPKKDLTLVEELDLENLVDAYDRGAAVPFAGEHEDFTFSNKEKQRLSELEKKKIRYQRAFSKKAKGSNNKERVRKKKAKIESKMANIRHNFAHQTSFKMVESEAKVLVFENLNLKNMTKSARGTKENPGKNVRQKAGLNKALLKTALGKTLIFVKYKAKKRHKYILLVNPYKSSQECALCAHIHPDNRKTQSEFKCLSCGHTDNADRNAAKVLKKRALKLILDLGTGLTLSATMDVIASEELRKSLARKSRKSKSSKNLEGNADKEGMTKISLSFTL